MQTVKKDLLDAYAQYEREMAAFNQEHPWDITAPLVRPGEPQMTPAAKAGQLLASHYPWRSVGYFLAEMGQSPWMNDFNHAVAHELSRYFEELSRQTQEFSGVDIVQVCFDYYLPEPETFTGYQHNEQTGTWKPYLHGVCLGEYPTMHEARSRMAEALTTETSE